MIGVVGIGALDILNVVIMVLSKIGKKVVLVDVSRGASAEQVFCKSPYCTYRRGFVVRDEEIVILYSDYEWHSTFLKCSHVTVVVDPLVTTADIVGGFVKNLRVKYSVILKSYTDVSAEVFSNCFLPLLYKQCKVSLMTLNERDLELFLELRHSMSNMSNAWSSVFYLGVVNFIKDNFEGIDGERVDQCISENIFGKLR